MNDSVLGIAERHSQAAAQFSLAGLEDARKRAHTLLVLLMAGGGGLAGVGLARWADTPALAVAALAGAVWWFALAAYVAWRGNTTAEVRAWATPDVLGVHQKWSSYVRQAQAEAAACGEPEPASAEVELRCELLRNCDLAGAGYRAASLAAFAVLDRAYRLAALAPVIAVAAVACWAAVGARLAA